MVIISVNGKGKMKSRNSYNLLLGLLLLSLLNVGTVS